jgi:sugar/nucleoside kinase (ribokinase family)
VSQQLINLEAKAEQLSRENVHALSGIACAGNWIVDYVHGIARWPQIGDLVRINWQTTGIGGGAANVATDLRALGAKFPVSGLGCIGDDEAGRIVQAHCRKVGLATDYLTVLPDVPTGQTHVMTLEGANRTFFYQGGANDMFNFNHINMKSLVQSGYSMFYLGYLALLAQLDRTYPNNQTGAAKLLHAAQQGGLITCVDLVSEEGGRLAQIVTPALIFTDYLIINEVEAERVSQTTVRNQDGTLNNAKLKQAAVRLLEAGVNRAVVIHAPERALWLTKNYCATWHDAAKVEASQVASTVGAGDAFCAGVLYGIHENWDPLAILRRGHLVAASCLRGLTATDSIPPMAEILKLDEQWVALMQTEKSTA